MGRPGTIEVPVPGRIDDDEREALRSVLEAVVALRIEESGSWREVRRRLLERGWSVECSLQWHVVAHCEREREEACGRTRDEAFTKLDRVTHARILEGTP